MSGIKRPSPELLRQRTLDAAETAQAREIMPGDPVVTDAQLQQLREGPVNLEILERADHAVQYARTMVDFHSPRPWYPVPDPFPQREPALRAAKETYAAARALLEAIVAQARAQPDWSGIAAVAVEQLPEVAEVLFGDA